MTPSLKKLVELYTIPAELREVADSLDRQWSKAVLGGIIPRYTVLHEDLRFDFLIDQEEMHNEKRRSSNA